MLRTLIIAAPLCALAACASTLAAPLEDGAKAEPRTAWESVEACEALVAAKRTKPRSADSVRVATWNVTWFPDGKPGNKPDEHGGTDLRWLACSLAWLDVDLVAMQEVKLTERGKSAMAELSQELERLTKASWSWHVDACADPYRQHLALLHRGDRLRLEHVETHGEIDPTTNPHGATPQCPGHLRPALAAYVRSLRGGLDFHVVNLHLDSGRGAKDFEHRREAWKRLGEVVSRRQALRADADVVALGDVNAMGCGRCAAKEAEDERALLGEAVGRLALPLRLASSEVRCTQFYRNRATALDQVLVSQAMLEARGASAEVSGLCAVTQCRPVDTDTTAAVQRLSDHCPLVIDLVDRDQD